MSRPTLEERVAAVEQRLAELTASPPVSADVKDWRRAIGLFPNNALMKEIDAAGQAWRERDRRRGRRPPVGRRRSKT
jgi:hypothetical protein